MTKINKDSKDSSEKNPSEPLTTRILFAGIIMLIINMVNYNKYKIEAPRSKLRGIFDRRE